MLYRLKILSGSRQLGARVSAQIISSTSGYLQPLEITRPQGCLGARPGYLERLRLSRGRLELSRAARLSRAASGYLEYFRLSTAARDNLAPRLSRRGSRLSRASQVISRPPRVVSSRQVISRGLRISRALRISRGGRRDNSGLEMARSAQDDSVRSG